MAFLIDESYLPAVLTSRPMTDEAFAGLCADHADLFFEMTAEGELIVMPPNYTLTGMRHSSILEQLKTWAGRGDRRGGGLSAAQSGICARTSSSMCAHRQTALVRCAKKCVNGLKTAPCSPG